MSATGSRILLFSVGQQLYGVEMASAQEVVLTAEIKPLPGAASDVMGTIALRGQEVPVIHVQQRLGISGDLRRGRTEVVISQSRGRTVGFAVGHVREVRAVDGMVKVNQQIPGQPEGFAHSLARVGAELVPVLDFERLAEVVLA